MILKQVIYTLASNSIEVTWTNPEGTTIVRHHSYAGEQMDELENDLGEDVSQYSVLIAEVRSRVAPPSNPVPVVPFTVTPFQAKAALYSAGLLSQITALMENPATPDLTKLAWSEVTEFTRDSPLLNGLAQTLGLTQQQVDEFFIAAAQIEI